MKKIIFFTAFMLMSAFTMPLFAAFESSTVNGNVIVTDTETGLIWQKTYVSSKTWQGALSYCENLTYAGYSDWRVPNKNELASLVNYGKYDPASDFPADMPAGYFWSSSTSVTYPSQAWLVTFTVGAILEDSVYDGDKKSNATHDYYVRCVRN